MRRAGGGAGRKAGDGVYDEVGKSPWPVVPWFACIDLLEWEVMLGNIW